MPDALLEQAHATIRSGSKSFAGAARLLPAAMRDDAALLYFWCRHCDDVVDGQALGHGRLEPAASIESRLARVRAATERALDGEREDPPFAALARVAAKHAFPRRWPRDLIAGFEMDAIGRRYRTVEDTLDYSYHVAGVVGLMMARIMGVRDEATLASACDLGIAFQLTNICRDVREDAAIGRCYLPGDRVATHAEAGAVALLLDVSQRYYDSALAGLRRLPPRAALGIAVARRVYREIGAIVGARGFERRATVSRARKVALTALALADATPALWGGPRRLPPRTGLWPAPVDAA